MKLVTDFLPKDYLIPKSNYIAFEGRDCVGKSVHSKLLRDFFVDTLKQKAFWTMEPNTSFAEIAPLTTIALTHRAINEEAREFLLMAARAQLLGTHMSELLEKYDVVISDRSIISGMVYAKASLGIDYDEWLDIFCRMHKAKGGMSKEKTTLVPIPSTVVFCHSTDYSSKRVNNDNHIYEEKDEQFKRKLESLYEEVRKDVIPTFFPKMRTVVAHIDRNEPVEENFGYILRQIMVSRSL